MNIVLTVGQVYESGSCELDVFLESSAYFD